MFATATEDMDALTFGSSVVLRHMTASEQKYETYMYMQVRILPELLYMSLKIM